MAKRSFLDFAMSDYAAAKLMLNNGFYDHCARLCHQTIEKYFKHIIEKEGKTTDAILLRSHKVHQLYDRITAILAIPVDKTVRSDLATISDYYFDNNYPGDSYSAVMQQEAENTIKIVNDIISSIGPGFHAVDTVETEKSGKSP